MSEIKNNQIIIDEFNSELFNILDYWMKNTMDSEHGGFHGKIDHFNNVIPMADKGAVLNARVLWTFSAVFNFSGNNKYFEIATRAFDYLKKYFYDRKYGGLIWEVDYLGNPINKRKQIYTQGFGIYGFSEYFNASGNEESLELAKELYYDIETHSYDSTNGGYLEALSEDWSPLEDMCLSEKDENYPKSMNTHVHILEPYTNLYRIWRNRELKFKLKLLIRTFLDHIINSETNHFDLFFERNWEVKSNIISYGHDIEGTWLLCEAAEAIGDQKLLNEVKNVALKMVDATINEGMDDDGSIFYELEAGSGKLDTDKHWWPQAEAIVGLMNAYQISNNDVYLQKAMDVWHFIKDKVIDREKGEWFWKVNKEGIPDIIEDKAGFWKCPYHNSRACLEAIHRLS